MMPGSTAKWEDLPNELPIDLDQLHKMNLELELVMIAITALAQIDRQEIGQIANEIDIRQILSAWRKEWPHAKFTAVKQLNPEQLRLLASIVNRLACKYQMVVRQSVTDWQQILQVDRLPLESPSLATYINNFISIYQARLSDESRHAEAIYSLESLSQAALNLLIELLFYGGNNGHQRLWQALLQRSQATVIPPIPI
jgi:Protein of unknown function (DUF3038)